MLNYTFVQNVKILTGAQTLRQIGELLQQAGYQKAFLVFDEFMKQSGVIDEISQSLQAHNIAFVEYGKVLPDPPADIIDTGAALCQEAGCDCVVAIGGGSSIDTGKGINVLRFNSGSILEYATKAMQPCTGLIVIPTTAGTGSELSNGAIISDTKNQIKVPILCFNNMPEYAILDPELTVGMPYNLTLTTGLDAFSHAAESYTSQNANPLTDFICEKTMETIIENLPIVLAQPQNLAAREKMQCAASIGGWMLYSASAHVGHSVAHVLGAQLHIVHGAACAYALSGLLKKLAFALPQKVKYIGALLGADYSDSETSEDIGNIASAAWQKYIQKLGLPDMPRVSISEAVLADMVQKVVQEPLATLSPIPVDAALAQALLKEILERNGDDHANH